MLNKNLRTVLYYVVTVSCLCLMIEFTKRIPDPRTSLSPQFYQVVTAKQSELLTLPQNDEDDKSEEVIPRRNRGRVKPKEKKVMSEESDYYKENDINSEDKEKFREWKKKNKFKASEVGLFKKWKKEMKTLKKKEFKKGKSIELVSKINSYKNSIINKEEAIRDDDHESDKEDVDEDETFVDGSNQSTIDTDDLVDYPGGIVEYAPPGEKSCSEFEVTDELHARQKSVREACDKFEDEMGTQKLLFSRLRWAVPERLLYCPVFKAASTSWLVNYLKLSNSSTNPKEGNLHSKITNLFPPPATFKLRKKIYSESIKFIIVRHPFERLVSAYRDKLAGFSRNDHYLDMRKHIITKYRKDLSDKSAIPTFSESVDFVLDELKKMEAGSSNLVIDGHFMPYTRRCIPCAIEYDVIIKFESLEDDSQYLIEQCNLEDKLQVVHENAAPTGPRTPQGQKNKSKKVKSGKSNPELTASSTNKALTFFKDIESDKIKQLYTHYKYDFEIFGYSATEYF